MTRDRIFAIGASIAVAAALALGFLQLGSPGKQRLFEADARRIQDLRHLASALYTHWYSTSTNKKLPSALFELPNSPILNDPLTHRLYDYRPLGGSAYRVCAIFALENRKLEEKEALRAWQHPAGYYCFSKDASVDSEPFF